ncbi:hypothetical protein CALVIDRAFT_335270 [Calocera viscosa TUFC12733]|uniref:Uncharacterized protein n=1 Tax=Calocera viscosa (strain TUFC12733) TaxID=1330018 RepID=A0A167HMT1_CALVF|nr:hypothetical protein CALVIDRAFT_335270 [Calocera viscosa TUFC12733]
MYAAERSTANEKNPFWVSVRYPTNSSVVPSLASVPHGYPFMRRLSMSTTSNPRKTLLDSAFSSSPSEPGSVLALRKRGRVSVHSHLYYLAWLLSQRQDPFDGLRCTPSSKRHKKGPYTRHHLLYSTTANDEEGGPLEHVFLSNAAHMPPISADPDTTHLSGTNTSRRHGDTLKLPNILSAVRKICPLPYLEECETVEELAAYMGEEGTEST